MDGEAESTELSSMIAIAAIIAIVLALVITGSLLIMSEKQHSSLYVIPESYRNTIQNDTISFTYGVVCSEQGGADYDIQIYFAGNLVSTEQFRLGNNEEFEKNESLVLQENHNVSYPAKIEVLLTNRDTMDTEDVHFWIKGAT